MKKKVKVDKPMIAILDNQDHLLCLLDDYTESNLHTFLQGTAAFFKCSVVQNSEYAQYFKVGNKVSFVWNDIGYHFDITATTKSEEIVSIQADSLTLELRNEDSRAYKASKAMTFKEYLDVFLFAGDNPIVLGINEVADKKLQLEWEGSEDSVLARLFSLANKFGAEIEFETVLNRHWGLDKIKLNVYREHDDKHQGIGKRRTDILLEYGHNIETIEIEENIDNLKTAIHATGKDGLTPASVLIDEKDADGNRLYYSPIGDGSIRAVQARNQFMSKVNGEGYIAKNWTYETDNPNVLAAQALAELKKISKVEVTVKIKGYEYLGIGDTILAQDTGYNPVLNLEARISEQDIYFDNPENNTSTFTNVEILKSEVDESLLTRVRELIEENKTYDVQILTSNGYSFKNGFGETTLTARVMDGPKDVTNEFNLTWFKNSIEYAHTASINVQAGSVDELATYLIIAEKDGRERGRNELTVFNVKDGAPGKTPVVHLAWSDSADGTVKFTLDLPTDWIPKYRGYYVDYSSVASTNPKLYKWERNPDDAAKVADEAKDKADNADAKADNAVSVANTAKDTADEASKQTALVNTLANTAKELADKANADATEANRLIGLANTEISKLNTNVNNVKSDLASAETDLNSKIETVKTTVINDYAKKTELSDTKITLNKTISDSVASVRTEMSEKYSTKNDLTTLQGEYSSFKEETAKKFSQQVSSIQTIQTDTTEAQRLANDAYSKANSAVTSATNASSTANSALTKASDATSVANSASQNASNAVASANTAVSTANTAKSNADKAIADVAALTKTVTTQSTRIDQTSSRIDQVASGVTEVGNRLDNLQIGGRNLLQHSEIDAISDNENSRWWYFSTDNAQAYKGEFNSNEKYLSIKYTSGNLWGQWQQELPITHNLMKLVVGDNLIIGVDVWIDDNTSGGNIGIDFRVNGKTNYDDYFNIGKQYSASQLTANTWQRIYAVGKITQKYIDNKNDLQVSRVILYRNTCSKPNETRFRKIKPELGNTPTSWSPAPEDQQSQIDGITNNLVNNYYQKTVVDSKLSTAVDGITASYNREITTRLGNYYDKSTIDSKLTIDGQGIASYVKSTQSKLDNLQVGGTNLIRNTSNQLQHIERNDWHIMISNTNTKDFNLADYLGQRLTLRIYISKPSVDSKLQLYFNAPGWRAGNVVKAGQSGYSQFTVDVPTALPTTWNIALGGGNGVAFRLDYKELKAEIGDFATSWSPHPDDIATLTQYTEVKQLADRISNTVYDSASGLVSKTTQLANSYAIKQLNSSGDILTSLNLNANTSTAEIDAKLIRLNGYTKMDDAFINNLVANSIVTNKIKSTEISGDIIKGGKIEGVTFKSTGSGAEPGEVEINDGTISMEKQEVGTTGRFFNRGFVSPLEMTMAKVGPIGGKIGLIRATSFTPFGFNNQALDTGNNVQNHRLFFHYQGLSIESDGANSGIGRNSGLKIFGDNAYIDLKPSILKDPGDDSDPIKMRIIATPNNTFEFRNDYGNIYMFTKNNENIVVNGYKIPYTWAESTAGIKYMRVIRPNESNPYIEVSNHAGKLWGVNMWLSDQRLKSNITTPTQDALATINQLQVRQFDWKSDNVHEDFGLVAQEVEQILPNAVFKVGDYYQIKDSGLIPVLIGAVQKLSNKVNLLENIIYNIKGGNLI